MQPKNPKTEDIVKKTVIEIDQLIRKYATSFSIVTAKQVNPLDKPLAELPKPPASFYFQELLHWTYNGYQTKKHEICAIKDFVKENQTFPLKPRVAASLVEPIKQTWDNITVGDLALQEVPGNKRKFDKSPAHHVFLLSILEAVKSVPHEFISTYAKQRAILDLFNLNKAFQFEGEYICTGLFVEELKNHLSDPDFQLIPSLYHFTNYGLVMYENERFGEYEQIEKTTFTEYTYEFGFSKQSSDNFTRQLIAILHERRNFILKINNIQSKSEAIYIKTDIRPDDRIHSKAEKAEIKDYFLKLNHKDKTNIPVMNEQDIDYLLRANFAGFEQKKPVKKFSPSINQANLRYFIYRFYSKYSKSTHEAEKYALFLKNNFSQFDNTEIDAIKKAFSRKPAKFPNSLI